MPTNLSKSTYRMLANDYRSGMSLRQIAAKRGYAWTAIKTACRKFGVPMRPRGASIIDDPERFAVIRSAIEGGMSQREARRQFNTSEDVIRRALGLPAIYAPKQRQRYHENKAARAELKAKKEEANRALAAEVDAAMRRDRERIKMLDAQRALRRVA